MNQNSLQNAWGLSFQNNDDHEDKTIGSNSVAVIKLTSQEAIITLSEKNKRYQIGNHWVMDFLPRILLWWLCIRPHSPLRGDGYDNKIVSTGWLIIIELTSQAMIETWPRRRSETHMKIPIRGTTELVSWHCRLCYTNSSFVTLSWGQMAWDDCGGREDEVWMQKFLLWEFEHHHVVSEFQWTCNNFFPRLAAVHSS